MPLSINSFLVLVGLLRSSVTFKRQRVLSLESIYHRDISRAILLGAPKNPQGYYDDNEVKAGMKLILSWFLR